MAATQRQPRKQEKTIKSGSPQRAQRTQRGAPRKKNSCFLIFSLWTLRSLWWRNVLDNILNFLFLSIISYIKKRKFRLVVQSKDQRTKRWMPFLSCLTLKLKVEGHRWRWKKKSASSLASHLWPLASIPFIPFLFVFIRGYGFFSGFAAPCEISFLGDS